MTSLPGPSNNYLNVPDSDASEWELISGLPGGRQFSMKVPGGLTADDARQIVETVRSFKPILSAIQLPGSD